MKGHFSRILAPTTGPQLRAALGSKGFNPHPAVDDLQIFESQSAVVPVWKMLDTAVHLVRWGDLA